MRSDPVAGTVHRNTSVVPSPNPARLRITLILQGRRESSGSLSDLISPHDCWVSLLVSVALSVQNGAFNQFTVYVSQGEGFSETSAIRFLYDVASYWFCMGSWMAGRGVRLLCFHFGHLHEFQVGLNLMFNWIPSGQNRGTGKTDRHWWLGYCKIDWLAPCLQHCFVSTRELKGSPWWDLCEHRRLRALGIAEKQYLLFKELKKIMCF